MHLAARRPARRADALRGRGVDRHRGPGCRPLFTRAGGNKLRAGGAAACSQRNERRDKGCVRELVPIAHDHGFYWGGHFTRQDGMHFELARLF